MKPKNIKWKTLTDYPDVTSGLIGAHEAFTINKEKKRGVYVLSSWAMKSELFNNSTAARRIGEYNTIEEAKEHAENGWQAYVKSLFELEVDISSVFVEIQQD